VGFESGLLVVLIVLVWEVWEMMLDPGRTNVLAGTDSYRSFGWLDVTCVFRCAIMLHRQEVTACGDHGGEQESWGVCEVLQKGVG
jgi:hypothetical protein